MTYDLDRYERETARIAEKQSRLYKWIGAITVAAFASFGYVALTLFNPALPATITVFLIGLFCFCAIKGVALRNEIVAAKQRQMRGPFMIAPSGLGKVGSMRGRYTVSTGQP
ncbi:hypothetical protein O4H61_19600 [Roseovarius aestuarii]|nr:hypothetical protein [Roseovarius aestuarii]